MLYVVFLTH